MMSEEQIIKLLRDHEYRLVVYVNQLKKMDDNDILSGSADVMFDAIYKTRAIIRMLKDILFPA